MCRKVLLSLRLALDMAVELKDEIAEAQCCFNAGNGSAACGDHSTGIVMLFFKKVFCVFI